MPGVPNVHSIIINNADILYLYKNITFSLYRLEQAVPLEYQDEAIQYLMDINISPITLWGMAGDKIINGDDFFKALIDGFNRNGYAARGNEMAKYKELKGKNGIYE